MLLLLTLLLLPAPLELFFVVGFVVVAVVRGSDGCGRIRDISALFVLLLLLVSFPFGAVVAAVAAAVVAAGCGTIEAAACC